MKLNYFLTQMYVCIHRDGASKYLKKAGEVHGTVTIGLSVGEGPATGKAWGCDLSYDYVKINAEYTS